MDAHFEQNMVPIWMESFKSVSDGKDLVQLVENVKKDMCQRLN